MLSLSVFLSPPAWLLPRAQVALFVEEQASASPVEQGLPAGCVGSGLASSWPAARQVNAPLDTNGLHHHLVPVAKEMSKKVFQKERKTMLYGNV